MAEDEAPKSGDGEAEEKPADEAPADETPSEAVEEAIAEGPPPSAHPPPPALAKAAWGAPLVKLDRAWTQFEARLCAAVLVAEIFSLCMWITLKGLAAGYPPGGDDKSGLVLRGLLGAVVLGYATHRAMRPAADADEPTRQRYAAGVTLAVVLGLIGSRGWANTGSAYFTNVLNWMQNACFLTLIGGLRGLATRLTLWLALLGASLATAQGKHINIDVVMRFLTPKARVPVAVIGWVAASVMCFAAVWGFIDHIAIENFHAPAVQSCPGDANKECDVPAGAKIDVMETAMSRDLFLTGRQLSLDLKSFPKVLGGTKYDDWMRPAEWNAWVDEGNWRAHFGEEDVQALKMPVDGPIQARQPIVTVPGGEAAPGLLVKELNFVFPLGMFMIALRFLLRALLVIAGWARVDPDAVHGEEEVEDVQREKHGAAPAAKKEAAS